jgi:hypothetical protein
MVRLRPTPKITFIGASLLKISAPAEWSYYSYSKGMVMPANTPRCQWISFRISTQDRDLLNALARQSGLRRAEFIRRAALSAPIASKTDAEMVRELKRLGAMLKHLYPKHSNWTSSEKERYWTAMNQITRLAAKLQTAIKKG